MIKVKKQLPVHVHGYDLKLISLPPPFVSAVLVVFVVLPSAFSLPPSSSWLSPQPIMEWNAVLNFNITVPSLHTLVSLCKAPNFSSCAANIFSKSSCCLRSSSMASRESYSSEQCFNNLWYIEREVIQCSGASAIITYPTAWHRFNNYNMCIKLGWFNLYTWSVNWCIA